MATSFSDAVNLAITAGSAVNGVTRLEGMAIYWAAAGKHRFGLPPQTVDATPADLPSSNGCRGIAVGRGAWLLGIVLVVLGGIYTGAFTPVEPAAIGAFLTFILALVRRKMTMERMKFCALETIKTFAMVYLIVIGAFLFSPFLAITEIPKNLAIFVNGLHLAPTAVLLLIVLGYIILGTFLEGIAILVLSIPIVYPAKAAAIRNGRSMARY